jgi:hypothetical protein
MEQKIKYELGRSQKERELISKTFITRLNHRNSLGVVTRLLSC